ncbi:hypothetical protein IFR04_012614 [Cadophora malorum]|uniref:Uncharacterized protein n=1 Tax=Cadophora malorum TaxID=108018 RepID=A0A8H7T845_9HELO|nr:hypothetical protein IFR04_012614 [Cadophora malorum]
MTASTLFHAVNNYWYANSGHAFDIGSGVNVVAEGNSFYNVKTPLLGNFGRLFALGATSSACKSGLGRNCERNSLGGSGSFPGFDTSMLSLFSGKNVMPATAPRTNQATTAGVGKI